MKKHQKAICLDFDGVVHSYESGWHGLTEIVDAPVPGAVEFIHRALCAGHGVSILSARSRWWLGRRAMRLWLKRHTGLGLWYDSPAGPGLENVKFPKFKPHAEVYIDDRGYRFDGSFPDLEVVMGWKPWNKTAVAEGIRKARGGPPPPQMTGFA